MDKSKEVLLLPNNEAKLMWNGSSLAFNDAIDIVNTKLYESLLKK